MNSTTKPPIVRAAQSNNIIEAALAYADLGMSVIPLKGKRPALASWTQYQATAQHQMPRFSNGAGQGCCKISASSVVRRQATWWFSTWTVRQAILPSPRPSRIWPRPTPLPPVGVWASMSTSALTNCRRVSRRWATPIGNLELCGQGRQVVAPPSIHPHTGQPYQVAKALDILHVTDLEELVAWIEAFKPRQSDPEWHPPSSVSFPAGDASLNPKVIDAIAQMLVGQGFRQRGDWLHGSCIHPERHQNGDRNPSFGFNLKSGYAHCYVCGTMLAKEVCETLNIDPDQLGGLVERPQPPN